MTTRRFWTSLLLAVTLATTAAGSAAPAGHTFVFDYENVLGTSLGLKILAPRRKAAERAERAVLAEIDRESHILSAWEPASEFSRWTRSHGEPVSVSPELFDVLRLFDQWRVRTGGALDPSAQAVIRVWTEAAARKRPPTDDELSRAVAAVRQQHWQLNATRRTAIHLSTAPLVLASFTKSFIIDRAAAAAMAIDGVHGVVLNVGGDIVARGTGLEPIAIANPRDDAENATPLSTIAVRNRAVATSGDYRRGVDIAGVHYSHIVDPRTGWPAGDVISSTVVASNPTDAGALATAFSILTPEQSRQLAVSVPGAEYLLVTKDGRRVASPGWSTLEVAGRAATPDAAAVPATQTAAARGQWDPTMELTVNFEIPVLGGAARRPFIALWIEDADRFPVRTLALWYHEDRFLTEMRAWYRGDKLRLMSENTSLVRSIGAATRPPGKYAIKWDGKDNDGNPVKAGRYTVSIESSREHGTYQLVRQDMRFTGTPQHFDFKPGTEIAGGSFDYHKIAK